MRTKNVKATDIEAGMVFEMGGDDYTVFGFGSYPDNHIAVWFYATPKKDTGGGLTMKVRPDFVFKMKKYRH